MVKTTDVETKVDVEGHKLPIEKCPSCGMAHEEEVKRYSRANSPFTHWFQCPETGDPVSMSLVLDDDGQPLQLSDEVITKLISAQRTGRYLVSIFYFDKDSPEEQRIQRYYKNEHLPNDELGPCIEWLRECFTKIIGPRNPRIQEAGPDVQRLPFNLFGEPKTNGE